MKQLWYLHSTSFWNAIHIAFTGHEYVEKLYCTDEDRRKAQRSHVWVQMAATLSLCGWDRIFQSSSYMANVKSAVSMHDNANKKTFSFAIVRDPILRNIRYGWMYICV